MGEGNGSWKGHEEEMNRGSGSIGIKDRKTPAEEGRGEEGR